jgi:BASS family bile acid:Na+ symporter
MEVMTALFNVVLLVFMVSTMLTAGLVITFAALSGAFRNVRLVAFVLVANLVLVPLIGWGTAAVLSLETPAYVALVLLACSPGGPFGAKLAMTQRGDAVTGSALMVMLAAVGSITFPITANLILKAADLGRGISLPVSDLVKTVALLQLLPFAIGLVLRNWAPETAEEWRPPVMRTSGLSFVGVLALSLSGNWREIVGLVGSNALIAGVIFGAMSIVTGVLVASGSETTRTTVGLLAPMRNSGPVFAAVGIGFHNDPSIIAAVTGLILTALVVALLVASYLAKRRPAPAEEAVRASAVESAAPATADPAPGGFTSAASPQAGP